jgi:omega-amidase
MKIALTKMNQAWEDKSQNMDICNQISSQASNHNIDLLIFPEMTLTGFTSQVLRIAEDASCSASLLFFLRLPLLITLRLLRELSCDLMGFIKTWL